MATSPRSTGLAVLTFCVGASCATFHDPHEPHDEQYAEGAASAYVLGPAQLWGRGGNVLKILEHSLPNLTVSYSAGCPEVSLRGARRLEGPSDPRIFVEGQSAIDTCILETLIADDIARIEVYPMGITFRPGYPSHAFGLILIFTRDATN